MARIFLSVLLLSTSLAMAQSPASTIEGIVTFSELRASPPAGSCGCFWMPGRTGEFAFPMWGNLSGVLEVSGQHTSNISGSNAGLSLVSGMGGLRVRIPARSRFQPYGQVLFGGVHAFGSYFPASAGMPPITNDSSFVKTAGGGLDVGMTQYIWIRAVQADYYRSQLRELQRDRQNQSGSQPELFSPLKNSYELKPRAIGTRFGTRYPRIFTELGDLNLDWRGDAKHTPTRVCRMDFRDGNRRSRHTSDTLQPP